MHERRDHRRLRRGRDRKVRECGLPLTVGECTRDDFSLRGEWLYSQGRGRHFRVGDQQQLSQYLAMVCPLSGEQLETEENRKLKLILSKAQQHQQQLKEQCEYVLWYRILQFELGGVSRLLIPWPVR